MGRGHRTTSMCNLPLLRSLSRTAQEKIDKSLTYLAGKHPVILKYRSIYDFVDAIKMPEETENATAQDSHDQRTMQAVAHHLGFIRSEVLRQLWMKGFLLGSTTID